MLFALPSYQFPYIVMNRCLYLTHIGLEAWQNLSRTAAKNMRGVTWTMAPSNGEPSDGARRGSTVQISFRRRLSQTPPPPAFVALARPAMEPRFPPELASHLISSQCSAGGPFRIAIRSFCISTAIAPLSLAALLEFW